MRLSNTQAETIRRTVASYDSSATVKLFGSQTRDSATGGDIDLLIFSETLSLGDRLQIEIDLQDALGLRRFDLLLAKNLDDPFVRLVNSEAIEL